MTAYIVESAGVALVGVRANAPPELAAIATIVSTSGDASVPFIVTTTSKRRSGAQSGPPPRRPLEHVEMLLGALGELACAGRVEATL